MCPNPAAPAKKAQRRDKGCTTVVQGMYNGCTREQQARNTGAMPEQCRSNTLAACSPGAQGRLSFRSSRGGQSVPSSGLRECADCRRRLPVFLHHVEHGERIRNWGIGLEVVDRAEDEAAAGAESFDSLAHLVPHFLRCAEGQGLLRVHAAAPEDQLVAVVLLERAGLHAFGGTLDGIEDVELGLDYRVQQRRDTPAAVHERLPRRVSMDPAVDALLIRQEQVAVFGGAKEGTVLGAEVGAIGLHDGRAVADHSMQAFEIVDRHFRLPLEYGLDVTGARGGADIPFFNVPDAFGPLEKCPGHQGDVAESQPTEGAEERLVRGRGEALGEPSVVVEFTIGDALKDRKSTRLNSS